MKKLLLCIMLFFCFAINVKAVILGCSGSSVEDLPYNTDEKKVGTFTPDWNDCLNKDTNSKDYCILIARYNSEVRYIVEGTWYINEDYYHINGASILYFPNQKSFAIVATRGYQDSVSTSEFNGLYYAECKTIRTDKYTTSGDIFTSEFGMPTKSGKGWVAYAQQKTINKFNSDNNYSTPKYAYFDSAGYDSLCFDNKEDWCQEVGNASKRLYDHTKMTRIYDLYENVIKLYIKFDETANKTIDWFINDAKDKLEKGDYTKIPSYCADITSKISNPDEVVYDPTTDMEKDGLKSSIEYRIYENNIMNVEVLPFSNVINVYEKYINAYSYFPDYKIRDEIKSNISALSEKSSELIGYCSSMADKLVKDGILPIEASEKIYAEYQSIKNKEIDLINKAEKLKIPVDKNFIIDPDIEPCVAYLGEETVELLQILFNIMKYIAIMILLVMSVIDYIKAIVSNDKDVLKKTTSIAVKRLIIAIIIFFVPILIEIILNIVGIEGGTCTIK